MNGLFRIVNNTEIYAGHTPQDEEYGQVYLWDSRKEGHCVMCIR